jgi:hypothetical protein
MTNLQIVSLYEKGLTPEEIQTAFPELSIEAIQMALAAGSVDYRADVRKGEQLFPEETKKAALMTMTQLLYAEEATLRYRASKFIINETEGRHNIVNNLQKGGNINVNIINVQLQKAQEALKRAKSIEPKPAPEAITV